MSGSLRSMITIHHRQQNSLREKVYMSPMQIKAVQVQMWRLNYSLVFQKQEQGALILQSSSS
ncbi:hypothetical protein TSUD_372670 [Trifolium subterraneum]|uniref:Uncharacterized protein n=1 Tax=Trifolium subterraneum TaxID=3900 RepID=A0A2Z6MAS3_TRISU|nr:hypothetical protein TSUD_372670 [Trifolium subterraneum]